MGDNPSSVGYLILGYQPSGPGWGTPILTWLWYPACLDLAGVLPLRTWPGYPLSAPHWGTQRKGPGPVTGVPPRKDMGLIEVLWDGNGVLAPWVWTDSHL